MITQNKDLKAGRPVWSEDSEPFLPVSLPSSSLKTEILIIGAGISGALMAEALSAQGFEVTIIDKRMPLKGSTSATTALLQYEIDQPMIRLSEKIGTENTRRAWQRSQGALQRLIDKTGAQAAACELEKKYSLYLSGNILNPEQLQQEKLARLAAGFSVEYLNHDDLCTEHGLQAQAALRAFEGYTANPVKLGAGYLSKAIAGGCAIYAPLKVIEIKNSENLIHVKTDLGPEITAKHVIFTCGYEVPAYIQGQNYKIFSTWAFASKQNENIDLEKFPLIWQAADPYIYVRSTRDGRIIAGGEDEEFFTEKKRNAAIDQKIEILQRKIHQIMPHLDLTAEYKWCGSFGETPTGLPLIGKIPHLENTYAVLAFGGNGITFSQLASEIIPAQIRGEIDPDADLFSFKP